MYYHLNEDGSILDYSYSDEPFADDCLYTEKLAVKAWNGCVYIEGEEPEPPAEYVAAQAMKVAKDVRTLAVEELKVEVDGMVFDGDELSQARMAVAASTMADDEVNVWVLADNSVVEVTKAQLIAAGRLARKAQSELWTKPYQA